MMQKNKNILIIGMSKMGKTHFGGQLYGRLKAMNNSFVLRQTPDKLNLFQDVSNRLNEGLEGSHTSTKVHEIIILPIQSTNGTALDIVYPDYGGEQLRDMIEQRQINSIWQNQIAGSNHWFLFVRLDLMEDVSDVTNKFYKQIEEEKSIDNKLPNQPTDLPQESSAFYVELIQTFLYVKQISLSATNKPNLTILLSCWDKLQKPEGFKPMDALQEKMPLLANFVQTIWEEENLHIVGLSSLGKDLNSTTPDADYAVDGPECHGYIVWGNGKKEQDITQVLNTVIA